MIGFEKHILPNGLKLLIHRDVSSPMAVVNILYGVGARDEDEERTGFAHLFEHLMFGGSKHIPEFDTPLEKTGGENNAFTNNDITNYYVTIPAVNLETAFWLESDRMLDLAFSEKSLEVQRKVVIEEFKQRYLNQPYGDAWLHLRPLAWKVHPYRWATIGKEISHIENATMEDVRAFYQKWYNPGNAIMCVAGNVDPDNILKMTEQWFGSIQKPHAAVHQIPAEPQQTERRHLTLQREVPFRSMYRAYHMPSRLDPDYRACDMISDMLSNGPSSRLYQRLVKNRNLFSGLNAYISGDADPGLMIVQGELSDGVGFDEACKAVDDELRQIADGQFSNDELEKVKNKVESAFEFSKTSMLNNAMNLCQYEWLGDAAMLNQEVERYRSVTREDLIKVAQQVFRDNNLSELFYEPISK